MDGMPESTDGWIWWVISAIIVGIAINLVSRKLETPIDNLYRRFYGSISARSLAKQQEAERIFALMVADDTVAQIIYTKQTALRGEANVLLVLLALMVSFAFTIQGLGSDLRWIQWAVVLMRL